MNALMKAWRRWRAQWVVGRPCAHCECPECHDLDGWEPLSKGSVVRTPAPRPRPEFPNDKPRLP